MRILAGVLAVLLAGCSGLPPVEVCYVHPEYGQVCVKVGGKVYVDPTLTPEQKREVEDWVKDK